MCQNAIKTVGNIPIQTYEEARRKHPQRWAKNIRYWSLPEYAALNPINEKELKDDLLDRLRTS